MPAYAVAKILWEEPYGPEAYLKLVQESLKRIGGKYLAFGRVTPVEGSGVPQHLALAEFPSLDAAKQFFESKEYAEVSNVRVYSARTDWLVLVDGLPTSVFE